MSVKPFLLCLLPFTLLSQPTLSRYEKCWAFWHPLAAIQVKRVSSACYKIYNNLPPNNTLDGFHNGGTIDAFRHVFFMAAFAQKVKPGKLRRLGALHEKANYRQFKQSGYEEGEPPDSLGSVMDLRNNEVGLTLGKKNRALSRDSLARLIITEIHKGNAWIMKRKRSGQYVTCDEKTIDLSAYHGIWQVPKCLVTSDYRYKD